MKQLVAGMSTLCCLALTSCSSWRQDHPVDTYPQGISMRLTPPPHSFQSSRDAAITAEIVNRSDKIIRFYTHDLVTSHCLSVHDARGKCVPTIPPPHPLTKRQSKKFIKTLTPGEKFGIHYDLNIFSPPLPDGTYRIKCNCIPSNTIKIYFHLIP